MESSPTRNRLTLALMVGIVALALIARILPGPRTIDDAFITFRYSRNIVEGQGFVYNIGEKTLGTTTPLFTVLMAAIAAVLRGEDFQWYAIIVSALADAGMAVFLFLLAERLTRNRWMGALIGMLWAISPASVTFAVGGMETSVAIFFMVGSVWLLVTDRSLWVGAFAALGLLTRIDALIWIGPLFLYQLWERWRNGRGKPILARIPWQTWAAFVIVLLPWIIFSTAYFGTPFANTVSAKTKAYIVPPLSALVTLIQNYSTPFHEFDTFGSIGAEVGSVVYLALSLFAILYAARKLPRVLPLLVYPWLYMAAFAIANPLIFRWYTAPPLPGLMLGIVGGAWAIIEPLRRRSPRAIPVIIGVLAVLWGGMSLHNWRLHPDHEPDRPAPDMAWHKIEILYQQVGTELREKDGVTPQTIVASADIGAIGYFSRATIIDTVGLVTPELSVYYPIPASELEPGANYAVPPKMIDDLKPPYLITMEGYMRNSLGKDPTFLANYKVMQFIPTDYYGTGMYVFKYQPGPSEVF